MQLSDFKDKRILVMGLGLHGGGVAVAKFFAGLEAEVTVTDLKLDDELTPSIAKLKKYNIRYVLGRHDPEDFKSVDLIIKNPGVPTESEYLQIAKQHRIPIDTALGIFWRLCPSKDIIGITGTKGKTTTTSLIYKIIKKTRSNVVMAGNIRISPLEILDKIDKDTTVVLELSSWNLDGLRPHKASPRIAVITNIYPDHLNRYKDMSEYINSKKGIFSWQTKDDFLVLNYDNQVLGNPSFHLGLSHICWFSQQEELKNGAYIKNGKILYNSNGFYHTIIDVKDIILPGKHNIENILAAVSATSIWGAKRTQINEAIKKFTGVSDRLELIKEVSGVKYYNDTTATTPDATIKALEALKGPIILIAGGADKKLKYQAMAKAINSKKIKKIILFKGDASNKLLNKLTKLNLSNKKIESGITSMPLAFSRALDNTEKGDTVLLSPGAASFGIFKNEFDRGDQFKSLIERLSETQERQSIDK